MAISTFFFYGTLKRGQRSNGLLAGQEFVGETRTAPHYRLYDSGPFPCLVEDHARGIAVRGELWRIDDGLLDKLDAWEDVPHVFVRREIDVPGVSPPVFGYIYQGKVTGMRDCDDHWPPNAIARQD
jgi:gamma-glutamylcyclotransferase (GGCT)/AIG2-like uncharacterized protein YtfP